MTAKLDAIDVDMLPALLVYRGGELAGAEMQVRLDGGAAAKADERGDDERRRGGGGSGEQGGEGEDEGVRQDRVRDGDDLGEMADELEDKLDDMGVYN